MSYLDDHVRSLVDAIRISRDLIMERASWETTLKTRTTEDAHELASLLIKQAANLAKSLAPKRFESVVLSGETCGVLVRIAGPGNC